MKVILALVFIGIAACTLRSDKPLFDQESLSELKSKASFETYSYEEHPFKDWSESEIQSLLGLSKLSLRDTSNMEYNLSAVADLPENFDSRQQWPECIHPIRDQGKCGSCWAFAASEVLSDRFCIASNGAVNVILSPQDMVSCDYLDHGCNGGILTLSWTYLKYFGIVSDECKPYSSGAGEVEKCPLFKKGNCKSENVTYQKYKASKFYSPKSIDEIKRDIQTNGPLESGFSVFDDFLSYKSGIYKKNSGAKMLGGHAVKIIGWGKENGTEYWIVANSWSEKWGIEGTFKIAFNECGIENVIAGLPKLA